MSVSGKLNKYIKKKKKIRHRRDNLIAAATASRWFPLSLLVFSQCLACLSLSVKCLLIHQHSCTDKPFWWSLSFSFWMDGTLCPLTCVCLPGMWHCRPVGDRQLGLELRSISRYADNVTVAVKKSRAFTGGRTRREELVASAVNLTRIMKKYHDLTTGCPHLYVSGSVSASVTTAWGILWVFVLETALRVCVRVSVYERER